MMCRINNGLIISKKLTKDSSISGTILYIKQQKIRIKVSIKVRIKIRTKDEIKIEIKVQ